MPLAPPNFNIGRITEYSRRIASIVGLYLAATACTTNKTEASVKPVSRNSECRTIIEKDRVDIYCFLKDKEKPQISKISDKAFKHAETKKGERSSEEVMVLRRHGGHLFNMRRLPGMAEECPTVMKKGEEGTPTKVYISFPELGKKEPRVIFYLHGDGGQGMKTQTDNVVGFTREMQKEGDPVILIAPQDGWGNFYPEGREKDQPGNWRDYNDPDSFANLIEFAEKAVGKQVSDITLASFSGGNIGIMKILRALEQAKDKNPEAATLYKKIQRIAYFDSAMGEGREYVARLMQSNPKSTVWSNYNHRYAGYKYGNKILVNTIRKRGIDLNRVHTERMPMDHGHGVYEEYFKRYTAR